MGTIKVIHRFLSSPLALIAFIFGIFFLSVGIIGYMNQNKTYVSDEFNVENSSQLSKEQAEKIVNNLPEVINVRKINSDWLLDTEDRETYWLVHVNLTVDDPNSVRGFWIDTFNWYYIDKSNPNLRCSFISYDKEGNRMGDETNNCEDLSYLDEKSNLKKSYSNIRFEYTINYPEDWSPEPEAENHDGKALYKDEEGNEVLVYGSNKIYPFSTQGNHLLKEIFILNDGTKATILKTKVDDKTHLNIFVTTDSQQFVLNASGSEKFIERNENLLKQIGKTFKINN